MSTLYFLSICNFEYVVAINLRTSVIDSPNKWHSKPSSSFRRRCNWAISEVSLMKIPNFILNFPRGVSSLATHLNSYLRCYWKHTFAFVKCFRLNHLTRNTQFICQIIFYLPIKANLFLFQYNKNQLDFRYLFSHLLNLKTKLLWGRFISLYLNILGLSKFNSISLGSLFQIIFSWNSFVKVSLI